MDGTHAQLVLRGRIDVYTLGGNWTVARQNQDAWLGQSPGQKTLSVDASCVSAEINQPTDLKLLSKII